MSIKLKEGKKSNYEVVCTFEKEDIEELKQNSLKDFQKDFKLD
jgi:predicted HicB family RNase H-like nuclease